MPVWIAEIAQSWRASLRRPGFLVLAACVLALGIGASVAVFTLIDAVLLRPLPYPQPAQLASVGMQKFGVAYSITPRQYQHIGSIHGVQSLGLIEQWSHMKNISGGGRPELVPAIAADRGLLSTLGVRLALGRNFTRDEDDPHGPKAVILSHGFWLRRYGGDAGVIGRNMSIEGTPYTIVGVLPASVDFEQSDLLLPLALPANSDDQGPNYRAVARLAPGTSMAAVGGQFQANMHMLLRHTGALTGPDAGYWSQQHFKVNALRTSLRAQARPVLMMFLASAAVLLLLAMVNLTNLVLLRSVSRSHDTAVRHALGASTMRRWLPMLAEGLLVGLGGALCGVAAGVFGLSALRGMIPVEWLAGTHVQLHASVVSLALVLGLGSALIAVLLGVWRSRFSLSVDELREGGRSGLSQRNGLLGRAMVVVQMALAAMLLFASGLFLHALYYASHTPLGFNSCDVVTFDLLPVKARYPDTSSVQSLTTQVVEQLRALSGVEQVTVASALPAGDHSQNFYLGNIHASGALPLSMNSPQLRLVSPGYFSAFDIPLLRGRSFTTDDRKGGEPVAIVNTMLAQRMFAGHALGKTIEFTSPVPSDGGKPFAARIVGVIGTISPFGPLGDDDGIMYILLSQCPEGLMGLYQSFSPLRFALRVHGDPESYRRAIVDAVARAAPDQPIAHVRSMQRVVHRTTDSVRLNLLLVGIFSVLALLLAATGMFAVVASSVAMREREFGVRLALGASPSTLLCGILSGGLLQVSIGLLAGLGLAFAFAGVLRSVLVQVNRSVFDPTVLSFVVLSLSCAGLLACLVPGLRASRVQPMRALRGD
ncbi:ABC transporter permease [Oleiagrimonas soli]|uniref:Putative permease n=1 Tax=Oleiagrimonas soli TaxID=1543381 RepID=A0A841KTU3_9GAMM|nr:ABC transporter permease [Oleiagrimonas soli]MBB6185358.1 putative permease [Oleiagrimonas soli]